MNLEHNPSDQGVQPIEKDTTESELRREKLSHQIGLVITTLREGKNRYVSVQGGVDDDTSGFTLNVFRSGRNLGLYHGKSEDLNDPEKVAQQVVMWAANHP